MARKPEETDSIFDAFSKLGSDLKLPKVDVEAILAHNRKNLEALEKSAKATAAGASSLLAKQREVLQDTLREVSDMAQGFRVPGNPQEMMTKQAEFARRSFEAAVKNAGEVAEIVKKSGSESIDILRDRIREAMEDIRSGFERRK
jgi:phasin family protein